MPHDRGALRVLVEKVRAAEGQDLKLDAEILCALLAPAGSEAQQSRFNGAWCVFLPNGRLWQTPSPWRKEDASLTGSLDAALALVKQVLPRWSLRLDLSEGYQNPCVIMGRSYPTNLRVAVEHRTAPLAVVLAAASALLAQAEAEAGGQHVG